MASIQALCVNGLGEADLLQNTNKPTALIEKLYEHPSITQISWNASSTKPSKSCMYYSTVLSVTKLRLLIKFV